MEREKSVELPRSEVECALAIAIRLLEKGFESADRHGHICTPEIILWTLDVLAPQSMQALRDSKSMVHFTELLEQFISVFPVAESLVSRAELDIPHVVGFHDCYLYVTAKDLLCAVEGEEWSCSDNVARETIARVLRRLVKGGEGALPALSTVGKPFAPAEEACALVVDCVAETGSAVALVTESDDALANALAHARRELLASDTGHDWEYWSKVYTSIVGTWLEIDVPSIAENLLERGQVVAYFNGVWEYVSLMRTVEQVWNRLGSPVRELLCHKASESRTQDLVKSIVKIDNAKFSEAETKLVSELVWSMLHRRAAYKEETQTSLFHSDESNDLIESVRDDAVGSLTCYVVETEHLPTCFREQTEEKQVLVVKLSENWLRVDDVLKKPLWVNRFFLTAGKEHSTTVLSLNNSFWADDESLWEQLFRFRRSVPVLYVFEDKCILAPYKFEHFSDLHAAHNRHPRFWGKLEIVCKDWLRRLADVGEGVKLPDGAPLLPSVVRCVNDLTSGTSSGVVSVVEFRTEFACVPCYTGRLTHAYDEVRRRSAVDGPAV